MQGSRGDADVEKRLVDMGREEGEGEPKESSVETHTLPCVQ